MDKPEVRKRSAIWEFSRIRSPVPVPVGASTRLPFAAGEILLGFTSRDFRLTALKAACDLAGLRARGGRVTISAQ